MDGGRRVVRRPRQIGEDHALGFLQPPAASTIFYDLNTKSIIKIGDSDRIPGGGLAATLSDGKLFVDGRNSDTSQFGFGVWTCGHSSGIC